jgi:hypothetical protein
MGIVRKGKVDVVWIASGFSFLGGEGKESHIDGSKVCESCCVPCFFEEFYGIHDNYGDSSEDSDDSYDKEEFNEGESTGKTSEETGGETAKSKFIRRK